MATTTPDCIRATINIVDRLMESEWYNYKQSGLQLAPIYLKVNQEQEARAKLFAAFKQCAADPLPMVRRSAAECLAEITLECTGTELIQHVKPLLKTLSEDVQDSVRAVSIKAVPMYLHALAKTAQNTDVVQARKEIFQKFLSVNCTEISWRTRYVCTDLFSQVIEAYQGY